MGHGELDVLIKGEGVDPARGRATELGEQLFREVPFTDGRIAAQDGLGVGLCHLELNVHLLRGAFFRAHLLRGFFGRGCILDHSLQNNNKPLTRSGMLDRLDASHLIHSSLNDSYLTQ